MKFLKQVDWIFNRKTIKICQNQHADFIRFFFTEKFLEIKKDLELVSRPHILQTFLIKNFLLFLYHAYAFDDVMKFRILKCQNLNISRTKSAFWNLLVVSKLIFFARDRLCNQLKVTLKPLEISSLLQCSNVSF